MTGSLGGCETDGESRMSYMACVREGFKKD